VTDAAETTTAQETVVETEETTSAE